MMSSLAGKIRGVFSPGDELTVDDIGERLGIQTYNDLRRIRTAIQWMKKTKDLESVRRGVYRKVQARPGRTYLNIIWHLIRSHRSFNADEIEMLSGARRATVREYLQCLVRAGYLRKTSWKTWHLVNDPGPETPVNSAKCKRLKAIRRKKNEG